jgi:hypothetical protein
MKVSERVFHSVRNVFSTAGAGLCPALCVSRSSLSKDNTTYKEILDFTQISYVNVLIQDKALNLLRIFFILSF